MNAVSAPRSTLRIVVIDDEPFAVELLSRQLANAGFGDVTGFNRAQDALDRIADDPTSADLLFCDLQMPETDGVEVLRSLASLGYTGGLVLVSGEDQRLLRAAETLAREHRLDTCGALHKPVAAERLHELLKRYQTHTASPPRPHAKPCSAEELRWAIWWSDELVVRYQPIVAAATGELVAVEALLHWQHPRDGLLPPARVVELAEAHGMIDGLTQATLRSGLQQLGAWIERGWSLRLSVDIAIDRLALLILPDVVAKEAADANVPLSSLVLEIAQHRLTPQPVTQLDILARLHLKRVRLSVDAFASAAASLEQLRAAPFEELKIAEQLVRGCAHDPALRTLVDANLQLARQLGIRSVATGVADAADWRHLRASGCELLQGAFIGGPIDADELEAWYADWRVRYAEAVA